VTVHLVVRASISGLAARAAIWAALAEYACTVTVIRHRNSIIPKSSFRGDAERRTRNPEVVAEIPGSRWRAPRNDEVPEP
jgi:hypothetical protein